MEFSVNVLVSFSILINVLGLENSCVVPVGHYCVVGHYWKMSLYKLLIYLILIFTIDKNFDKKSDKIFSKNFDKNFDKNNDINTDINFPNFHRTLVFAFWLLAVGWLVFLQTMYSILLLSALIFKGTGLLLDSFLPVSEQYIKNLLFPTDPNLVLPFKLSKNSDKTLIKVFMKDKSVAIMYLKNHLLEIYSFLLVSELDSKNLLFPTNPNLVLLFKLSKNSDKTLIKVFMKDKCVAIMYLKNHLLEICLLKILSKFSLMQLRVAQICPQGCSTIIKICFSIHCLQKYITVLLGELHNSKFVFQLWLKVFLSVRNWSLELIHLQYRFKNVIRCTFIILVVIIITLIYYVYSKNARLKVLIHSSKYLKIIQVVAIYMNLKYTFLIISGVLKYHSNAIHLLKIL